MKSTVRRVAVLGNYLPRKCGLATFTTDVCESVASAFPHVDVQALAMNDIPEGYDYPDRVRFEIEQQDPASYKRAVEYLNQHDIDVLSLQHEYGIFGGPEGSHIVPFLRQLRAPIVPTLHTILENPTEGQRHVLKEVAGLSDRVIVMSERGARYLHEIYKVPREKIDFIHHGIPNIPFIDPNYHKDKFGVPGKTVLLTFGLLSPNKGIEYVIRALPDIVADHPDVVYLCVGATHPNLVKRDGERYRESLIELAESLGVRRHVKFHNRFVELDELCEYIGAADVYITPYLNEAQITSGTLAYATGAGKAVISTPYWYAQELLADGRGILVPFRNEKAIAEQVTRILTDDHARHTMRKRAFALGRTMIWSEVAKAYMDSFERAIHDRNAAPRVLAKPSKEPAPYRANPFFVPEMRLTHVRQLTDGTGIIQHATYNVPNYEEGYCTDDNARALLLATLMEDLPGDMPRIDPCDTGRYLAFLRHAFNQETGRFRNFMGYDRRWLEEAGSEDSQGRALWALGTVSGRAESRGLRELASRLLRAAAPATASFHSPRSQAFTIIGLCEYAQRYDGDRSIAQLTKTLAQRLLDAFWRHEAKDWPWCENILAYANAKIPHALITAGRRLDNPDMTDTGLKALAWLMDVQRSVEGHFAPVGSNGWYRPGKPKAQFDQQPIEAHASVSACLEAYRVTQAPKWKSEARMAFDWFLGANDLGVPVVDFATGACFDGLHPHGVNQNQGAESLLAYLASQTEILLAFPDALVSESTARMRTTKPTPRPLKPASN